MSESSALQQKLLGFCQAGRVLNSEEVAENEQLAEFVKWHLRQCAHRLLEESKHRPVLFAYSSDATPVLTQTSAVSASSSATPLVVRRGKVLEELLMQRGLVKTFAGTGQPKMAVVMADPVPLSEGKKPVTFFLQPVNSGLYFDGWATRASAVSILEQIASCSQHWTGSLGKDTRPSIAQNMDQTSASRHPYMHSQIGS